MQISPEEVNNLTGKFIIQLDTPREGRSFHKTINEENWGFIKEKRLSFVCGLTWQGFYYEHKKFKTAEEFSEYFNNYLEEYKGERYHRLLTSKELDFILNKMKQENY
jgi:hypothetical protein